MDDDSEDDYRGEYADLNDNLNPTEEISFPLFEHKNAAPAAAQGQVKTLKPYHVEEDSSELYADQHSDYSITVQRLLWIDGHEKAHAWVIDPRTKQKAKQEVSRESTLVVLKIQMHSLNEDQKFQWMTATLALEDAKRGGTNHPEVQAWAPWRKLDRRNEVVGHREVAERVEAGAKGGYQGAEISIGGSREGKISWDQTFFDEARSTEVLTNGKQNGVTWFAKQNKLQDQGVTPEVWVSALFSRSSRDPYLVNFNIYAHAGTLSEFAHSTKRFFGLGPGRTKTFSITPGKQQVITREGEYIMEGIDVADFGKLRDKELSSSLNVTWGPAYQTQTKEATGSAKGMKEENSEVAVIVEGERTKSNKAAHAPSCNLGDKQRPVSPPTAHLRTSRQLSPSLGLDQSEPVPSRLLAYPAVHTLTAPTAVGNVEYTRLVTLEGRVADTEARIATQDKLILQLQRELMAKDAQLAGMTQTLHELTILRPKPAER